MIRNSKKEREQRMKHKMRSKQTVCSPRCFAPFDFLNMKTIFSIVFAYSFALLPSAIAIGKPGSFIERDLSPQALLGYWICQRSLKKCSAKSESFDQITEDLSAAIAVNTNDEETLAELESILVEADVSGFTEGFQQLEETMTSEQVLAITAATPAIMEGLDNLLNNLKNKKDEERGGFPNPLVVLQGLLDQFSALFDGAFNFVFRGVQGVIDSTAALTDGVRDNDLVRDVTEAAILFLFGFVQNVLFAQVLRNKDAAALLSATYGDAETCDAELMACEYRVFLSNQISMLLTAAVDSSVPP